MSLEKGRKAIQLIPEEQFISEGNQPSHQFEEWDEIFEVLSRCKKLGMSELEVFCLLSNRYEIKRKPAPQLKDKDNE